MNCENVRFLLDGYSDGELDLVNHVQIEMHLDECSECGQLHENKTQVKAALMDNTLYYRAPAGLRERVLSALEPTEKNNFKERWLRQHWWYSLATTALAAVVIFTLFLFWQSKSNTDSLAQEIVASHVRSLMADHLTDIPSTDQHTVKPWFDGRLDFAPPVIDLGPQGFVLIGGRLDYVSSRQVAALVYIRRQHVINLFIYPEEGAADGLTGKSVKQGYNVVHWNQSGMSFWAVSDLNPDELQQFSQLYQN